jgi:hypothetical protein
MDAERFRSRDLESVWLTNSCRRRTLSAWLLITAVGTGGRRRFVFRTALEGTSEMGEFR